MKKILSYILIFVIVFVNLFAPFSVGIENNHISTIINSAQAENTILMSTPDSHTPLVRSTYVQVNATFRTTEKYNKLNVIYFIGKNLDQNNYKKYSVFTEDLTDNPIEKTEGNITTYNYDFGQAIEKYKDDNENSVDLKDGETYYVGIAVLDTPKNATQSVIVGVSNFVKFVGGVASTTGAAVTDEQKAAAQKAYDETLKNNGTQQQALEAANAASNGRTQKSGASDAIMPPCGITNLVGCMAQGLYYIVFVPTSYLFALAGILFDNAFAYSVQDTSYRSAFVTEGWGLVRDFCNMFFIFILLYTAISTILGIHGPSAKQTIVRVVIIGLFINFSLFVTQLIIDASNVTARVFYNADTIKITEKGQSDNTLTNAANGGTVLAQEDDNGVISLSEGLVNKVNPQNLIINASQINDIPSKSNGVTVQNENKSTTINTGTFVIVTVLATIVNIIGMLVFISVAFIFVSRVVGLWVAMILSPLAFFTYILPSMQGTDTIGWKNWWPNTLKMAFLAPVFIFFLYIILKFLSMENFLGNITGKGGMTSVVATILPFVFIMVLLTKAKSIATKMSGEIGQQITSKIAMAGGVALGAATGGVAMLGRSTLGNIGAKLANNASLARAEAKGGISGYFAKMALKSGDKLQSSSFDVRATKAGKAFGKETGTGSGLGFVSVNKGGYKGLVDSKIAERTKRSEELKHIATHHEQVEKRKLEVDKKMLEDRFSEDLHRIDKEIEDKRKQLNDYPPKSKEREDLQKEISDLKAEKGNIVGGKAIKGAKNEDGTNKYNTTDGHISKMEFEAVKTKMDSDLKTVEDAKNHSAIIKGGNGITGKAEATKMDSIAKAEKDRTETIDKAMRKEESMVQDAEKALAEAERIAEETKKADPTNTKAIDAAEKAAEKARIKLTSTKAEAKATSTRSVTQANENYNKEVEKAEEKERQEVAEAEKQEAEAIKQATASQQSFIEAEKDSEKGFGQSIKELGKAVDHTQHKIDKGGNEIANNYANWIGSKRNRAMNFFSAGGAERAMSESIDNIRLGIKTKSVDTHTAVDFGGAAAHASGGHDSRGGDKHESHDSGNSGDDHGHGH